MDNIAIFTAVVAASAATIGTVVSKDGKISEFRQQWIDSLRDDVAKNCSVSLALYRSNVRDTYLKITQSEGYGTATVSIKPESSDALVEEANHLLFRIKLRLNTKEEAAERLIGSLAKLVSLCTYANEMATVVDEAVQEVLDDTQAVLKQEWNRVRKGERRFQLTFRFALSALIASLAFLFLHWAWQRFGWLVRF